MSRKITEFLNSKKEQVELSSQKIELTIVGDMEKELKNAAKELESVNKLVEKAKQPLIDAISANRQAGVSANNVLKLVDNFDKQAKELGIQTPSNVNDIKQRAEKIIADFKSSQANLISVRGQL